jgi:hypothetical protein
MGRRRGENELTIHHGHYRSFEWFWDADDSMPGLDAYESLPPRDQNDFLACAQHWGDIPPGVKPLRSRINEEHKKPLIVALKAGKHRFTAFRDERGSTWIVCVHYVKRLQQRDKAGDRAVFRTVHAREDYFERVNDGTYYERK